ncbi:hypothetical protein AC1031_015214 [Aphanomyces cochlioides]|nr:hypothetical protein AC1031_015214 [Aphanomyces cochlioides]
MSIPESSARRDPPPFRPMDPPPPWCRRPCRGFKIGFAVLVFAIVAFFIWHCPCRQHRYSSEYYDDYDSYDIDHHEHHYPSHHHCHPHHHHHGHHPHDHHGHHCHHHHGHHCHHHHGHYHHGHHHHHGHHCHHHHEHGHHGHHHCRHHRHHESRQVVTKVGINGQPVHLVELNVGGTYFTTTNETLLSCDGSVFHALLSRSDLQAVHFIDWTPRAFDHVLKGLRLRNFDFIHNRPEDEKTEVESTLQYLKIDLTSCGLAASDDAVPGEPLVCPKHKPTARRSEEFEELGDLGDPESGVYFTKAPISDSAREYAAAQRAKSKTAKRDNQRKGRKHNHHWEEL